MKRNEMKMEHSESKIMLSAWKWMPNKKPSLSSHFIFHFVLIFCSHPHSVHLIVQPCSWACFTLQKEFRSKLLKCFLIKQQNTNHQFFGLDFNFDTLSTWIASFLFFSWLVPVCVFYIRYTIVLMYYALSVGLLLLVRPIISHQFCDGQGHASTYAALYFLPSLVVLQASFGGLICK